MRDVPIVKGWAHSLIKGGISYEKIIVNEEDKKETLDTAGAKERTYPQVFINETLSAVVTIP